MWWELILNSLLLGVGLAMDACAVSMANGLNEPQMKVRKIAGVALTFGFFQALMPMIGWVCVHFVTRQFEAVTKAIPYIALVLLAFIGGKMIFEGTRHKPETDEKPAKPLTFWVLIVQALATSIDALSVGFTIAEYDVTKALVSAGIIAVVTFAICFGAVFLGKKFGTALGNKAEIAGGAILICIGIEIFVKGVFFA
ncbi:MAG: manganese efflux pump MntP family protein [Corallococcus sp.]|nr:manganese efflux pump MntP family protein [Corallococcus sp.]MCM1359008.1 manganese efflux pump MntP family protein [Corallococcus sp.]MCM1394997.1 manganese efflux pump MntP family protein [Corallococcus sp.]